MACLISVIIPIYNAKQTMFYTVDNLLNQTLHNIELILVDDCSTDGSAALLEERYAPDRRVRVLRQERNGGPGEARNRGIEEACGTYVCFCDSDDQMTPTALEEMVTAAVEWDADVVHSTGVMLSLRDETPGDMLMLPDDGWCVVTIDQNTSEETELIRDTPEHLLQRWMNHELHWSAWNKLYRREMLLRHHIRFGKMRLAEDQQFCFCCLFWAERYLRLSGARYYYRRMPTSLSRGRVTMKFLDTCLRSGFEISRSMEAFGQEHPWFREHPQANGRAADFILECLEDAFTRPAWYNLGEDAILADEGIRALFREYFGDLALFALKQSCDAHRQKPEPNPVLELLNSPAGLRQMVQSGKLYTLKEYKERHGESVK